MLLYILIKNNYIFYRNQRRDFIVAKYVSKQWIPEEERKALIAQNKLTPVTPGLTALSSPPQQTQPRRYMDHIESPASQNQGQTRRYMDHIECPAPQKRYMDHIESPAQVNSKKSGAIFKKGQEASVRDGIIQVLSTDPYLREELAKIILSDSKMLKSVIVDIVKTDKEFRNDLIKALTENNTDNNNDDDKK